MLPMRGDNRQPTADKQGKIELLSQYNGCWIAEFRNDDLLHNLRFRTFYLGQSHGVSYKSILPKIPVVAQACFVRSPCFQCKHCIASSGFPGH